MPRYSLKTWVLAARPFSFTASATPVLLGSALAFWQTGGFDWILFFAALIGGMLVHAGTNLVSDYFDFKKGVDRVDTFGGSRVIVDGKMNDRDVLVGGLIAFGIATLIGVYLLTMRGWPIVMFGMVGILGGYFYTGGPLGYKYRALGEFLVFTLMGPLMVWGAHFTQVGALEWKPVLISVPVGFLVAAILYANNLRDIEDDTTSGYNTQASIVGRSTARFVYAGLLISAYVFAGALVGIGEIPVWALLVLLSIPAALKVNGMIQKSLGMERKSFAMIDVMTAQLHFQFGLLMTIGIVLGHFFKI